MESEKENEKKVLRYYLLRVNKFSDINRATPIANSSSAHQLIIIKSISLF